MVGASELTTSPGHASQASRLNKKLATFFADIKISHTIFAMPFALLSTFLAARGWPKPGQLGLILLCMVTARTTAMAMNRLLDAELDARNPRTRNRAIPGGKLSQAFVLGAIAISAATFLAATALFRVIYHNPWPLILGGPVLAFLCAYPLLKRFTRLCHYYLGMALALAPICAWIAIAGRLAMPPIWMALAVTAWTAGFDILYACQDYASDIEQGIFSVPAKLGIRSALWVARLTHVVAFFMLIQIALASRPFLGNLYWYGLALAGVLLVVEHSLVRANDLSKINVAFFTVNGLISLTLGVLGVIDILNRSGISNLSKR